MFQNRVLLWQRLQALDWKICTELFQPQKYKSQRMCYELSIVICVRVGEECGGRESVLCVCIYCLIFHTEKKSFKTQTYRRQKMSKSNEKKVCI